MNAQQRLEMLALARPFVPMLPPPNGGFTTPDDRMQLVFGYYEVPASSTPAVIGTIVVSDYAFGSMLLSDTTWGAVVVTNTPFGAVVASDTTWGGVIVTNVPNGNTTSNDNPGK